MTDEIHYDSDGFEIPDEYWPLASDEECLHYMSLREYNQYINIEGEAHKEVFRLTCIANHLKWGAMTARTDPIASIYDPTINAIITKPGFTFNKSKCQFEKL